jgi:tetratricopeptide (TPR) repeat protein
VSVINKMLRDLDARRAASAVPAREAAGLTRDTASVKARPTAGRALFLRILLLVTALVLAAAAAWWYVAQREDVTPSARPPQISGIPSAPLPLAPASAIGAPPAPAAAPLGEQQLHQMLDQAARSAPPGPATAALVPPPAAAASAAGVSPEQAQQMAQQVLRATPGGQMPLPQSPGLAYELQQQLAKPPAPATPIARAAGNSGEAAPAAAPSVPVVAGSSVPPRTPVPKALPAPTRAPLAPAAEVQQRPPTTVARPPAAAETEGSLKAAAPAPKPSANRDGRVAADPPSTVHPRQAAALETLAQARALWNAGSREAALDVMRQAVAVAERAQASAPDAAALPAFQTLVRELARMELAQGQPGQVLELLVRLEPLLGDQADLWAVRGNAAQRLGRHADSVQAYQTALKLRPGEPRWMLASAVSLAALGQVNAAAEQAEKARAAGAVSQEVLTYLRQMGVPVR